MRKKLMLGMVTLALVAALVGGATMAWFTDFTAGGSALFTAGTVEISAGQAIIGGTGTWQNWNPGDCNEAKWCFTNSGSKSIYLRTQINKGWESDGEIEYINGETAWGEGPRINEQGNWAMYFTALKGQVTTTRFLAGQHIDVGTVKVWNDSENLYVEFNTKNNWVMRNTHLYLGSSQPEQSAPGQFSRKHENLNYVTTDTYTIPLNNSMGNTFYIAAHADVYQAIETGGLSGDNVKWNLCPEYENDWTYIDGYYYYRHPVAPNEQVCICFTVCLDGPETNDDYQGAIYKFNSYVEAIQSSNNAVHSPSGWVNNPYPVIQ